MKKKCSINYSDNKRLPDAIGSEVMGLRGSLMNYRQARKLGRPVNIFLARIREDYMFCSKALNKLINQKEKKGSFKLGNMKVFHKEVRSLWLTMGNRALCEAKIIIKQHRK